MKKMKGNSHRRVTRDLRGGISMIRILVSFPELPMISASLVK